MTSSKFTPTSMVRADDPEAADLADAAKLLGPARMVLDACAEDRPGHQAEAADMAQRIVDLIGHSSSDEPPHVLIELEQRREQAKVAAGALYDCLRHLARLDESNAGLHCATVRYGPLTFKVAEALASFGQAVSGSLAAQVLAHAGDYPLDTGR